MRFLLLAVLFSLATASLADDGLVAHWPLKGDLKDRGPHALHRWPR